MKQVLALVLSLVMLFGVPMYAYAEKVQADEKITNATIDVVKLGDHHEIVYYEGVLIEDVTTAEYRKIINTNGTDKSVYYEDFYWHSYVIFKWVNY